MSGGRGETDPTWSLMLFILIIWGFAWLAWYFWRGPILEAERWIRAAEIWLAWPFDHQRVQDCFTWLKEAKVAVTTPKVFYPVPTREAQTAALACFSAEGIASLAQTGNMQVYEYYDVTPTSLGSIADFVNGYLRWPVLATCIAIGTYAIFYSPRNKFKTRYSLEGFIRTQAKMWPVINPIVNFNPTKSSARIPGAAMPDKTPMFAEAFSPEEWLSFHRIPITNGIPDKEAVRRALTLQLGPRWQGLDDMPPYILVLFVAFALKGVQQREASDEMLGKLGMCWSEKGGFQVPQKLMEEIRKLAKDPNVGGRALEVANKHAYRTTALLGVLKWARFMGGVLAPAHFLWLRAVDRNLWYPLNNLGRRSFHTEGAGAMAHFMAEVAAQRALIVPRVDTANVSLQKYVSDDSRFKVVVPPREETKPGRALQIT